jgi:hypothetical protein
VLPAKLSAHDVATLGDHGPATFDGDRAVIGTTNGFSPG